MPSSAVPGRPARRAPRWPRAALRPLAPSLCLLLLACGGAAAPDDRPRDDGPDDGRPGEVEGSPSDGPAPAMDAGTDAGAGDAGSEATPDDDDEDGGVDGIVGGCGAGECDLLDPRACDDDEGCLWLLDEDDEPAAICLAVGGGLDGDACESALDCAPGLDCTALDGSGTCRRYCCDLNDTGGCPGGQFCRVLLGLEGQGEVALCDACDICSPTSGEGCPSEQGCYPLPGADACNACLPSGGVAAGEPCEAANDCEPGAGCFAVEGGERRCHAFCVLDGAKCESGNCRQVEGATLPEAVGLCL